MRILETENVQEIYLLKFFDNQHYDSLNRITFTIEEAYDLAQNFLNDTFNATKEEVVDYLTNSGSDYIEIYNEEKINYWNDIYKKSNTDLKQHQYYFRIVRD